MPVSNDFQLFFVLEYCQNVGMIEVLQFYVDIDLFSFQPHHLEDNVGPSNVGEATNDDVNEDVDSDPIFDGGNILEFVEQEVEGDDDPDFEFQEDDEIAKDEEEDDYWLGNDDDDDNGGDEDDNGDGDGDGDSAYENPQLPLVHPPPYSEIDLI